MDKQNLYYLVIKGTNDRALTTDKTPLISDAAAADRAVETWALSSEKISIADFEKMFVDKDAE